MTSRINKYLAEHGYCSRREADSLIKAGIVFVNGKRAGLGDQVSDTDKVEILGRVARAIPKKTYLVLNKPVGYVTTTSKRDKDTIMSLVPSKDRLFPVGQLDVGSSGLLLMTNDGELANRLTHPKFEHVEEYDVSVNKPISDSQLKRIDEQAKRLGPARFSIILREGRNRQIRRTCDAFGYTVTSLKRIRVQNLKLDKLATGKWRELTPAEVSALSK